MNQGLQVAMQPFTQAEVTSTLGEGLQVLVFGWLHILRILEKAYIKDH